MGRAKWEGRSGTGEVGRAKWDGRSVTRAKGDGRTEPTYVCLPPEHPGQARGLCGLFLKRMYGTRSTADGWQQEHRDPLRPRPASSIPLRLPHFVCPTLSVPLCLSHFVRPTSSDPLRPSHFVRPTSSVPLRLRPASSAPLRLSQFTLPLRRHHQDFRVGGVEHEA